MYFHKERRNNFKYKELKTLSIKKIDLFNNNIISLNENEIDYYKKECQKLGYSLIKLNDIPKQSKKQNKPIDYISESEYEGEEKEESEYNEINDKRINKKKNNKKNQYSSKKRYQNISDYNYFHSLMNRDNIEDKKNNGEALFSCFKSISTSIENKQEKKYVPDKKKMTKEEKRALQIEIMNKIENLSLIQMQKISQKFFNAMNGEIKINLLELSQEKLKRLKTYVDDYYQENLINPNFVSYKEELKKKKEERRLNNNILRSSDSDDEESNSSIDTIFDNQ